MPNDSPAQRLAVRRVQNTLKIRYTRALRLVTDKKTDDINWGQAADAVIAEAAGDGFTEAAQ